jgi:hypothetical protein
MSSALNFFFICMLLNSMCKGRDDIGIDHWLAELLVGDQWLFSASIKLDL